MSILTNHYLDKIQHMAPKIIKGNDIKQAVNTSSITCFHSRLF